MPRHDDQRVSLCCRVGLAPTGKRRLVTAHTLTGHSAPSEVHKTAVAYFEPLAKAYAAIVAAISSSVGQTISVMSGRVRHIGSACPGKYQDAALPAGGSCRTSAPLRSLTSLRKPSTSNS